jgi:PAS domain S-box-containing protein
VNSRVMQPLLLSPATRMPFVVRSRRRLGILGAFLIVGTVTSLLRLAPWEVPALLVVWLTEVWLATRLMLRAPTSAVAERIETISFLLAGLLLTGACFYLGGATWLAAAFYVFHVMVAGSALTLAGSVLVAATAWLAFGFLTVATALGWVYPLPFGPDPGLSGNVTYAWVTFIITGVTMALAVFIQQALVGTLRRSEAEQRLLVEASTDLIMTLDSAGTILSVNETAATHLGIPAAELIDRAFIDLVSPKHQDRWIRQLMLAISGQRPRFELVYLRSGSAERWIAGTLMSLSGNSDGDQRLLVIARDVTEEKHVTADQDLRRAQIAESLRLDSLQRWVREMTREVENSLVAIRGSAEAMLGEGRADRDADAFREITRHASKSAALLRDLAARAAGKQPPERPPAPRPPAPREKPPLST